MVEVAQRLAGDQLIDEILNTMREAKDSELPEGLDRSGLAKVLAELASARSTPRKRVFRLLGRGSDFQEIELPPSEGPGN